MAECPICGKRIVPASGRIDSEILLAGEFPGAEEMMRGVPFVGETGKVLEYELFLVGINMRECRLTNLWQHYKPASKKVETYQSCYDQFVMELIKEMRGRKVLLMGSENANTFLPMKISACAGLLVESALFPKDVQFVQMCVNPAVAINAGGTVGELRLAIQKFARRINENK